MKKSLSIFAFVCAAFFAKAQDPQFTQFYAVPQYLNPAFAGLTDAHRFTALYRTQWPGINTTYKTYLASYDKKLASIKSGAGLVVLQDKAGSGDLTHTQAAANYAYHIDLNFKRYLCAGITASYNSLTYNFDKYVFTDNILSGSPVSQERPAYFQRSYIDLGAGLMYNSDGSWIGVTVKHLNKPDYGMVVAGQTMPMYIGVNGGYKIKIGEATEAGPAKHIMMAFNYRHELKYDQLDLGGYFCHSWFTAGVFYRGLPMKSYAPGYPFSESIAFVTGFNMPSQKLKVGYAYDVTISTLQIANSKGAHEISLLYEFGKASAGGKKASGKKARVTF